MSGEGGTGLTVNEEPYLSHAGQVGSQGAADGEHCQRLGFKARRMAGGKGAGQVDNRKLGIGILRIFGTRGVQQEHLCHAGSAAGHGVGGVGGGIEVQQLAQQDARARAGVRRQRQRACLWEQGAVCIVGDQQGCLLCGRNLRRLGGRRRLAGQEALVGTLAEMPGSAPMPSEATSRMTKRIFW